MYIIHIGSQTLVATMPQNIEDDSHVLTINKDMSTPDEDILKFLAWHGFDVKRAHVICIIFGIMNMSYLQEYIDEFMRDKENLMPNDLVNATTRRDFIDRGGREDAGHRDYSTPPVADVTTVGVGSPLSTLARVI